MTEDKFDVIKKEVQLIINFIGNKNFTAAELKLTEVSQTLNDLIDVTDDETVLREISKYQVLLELLFKKIN